MAYWRIVFLQARIAIGATRCEVRKGGGYEVSANDGSEAIETAWIPPDVHQLCAK
jgi:hypothetical protein